MQGTDLKRLHRDWRRRTDHRLALLLDGVQQPFNVGAIIRTAAAFGVEHLYLAGGVPSPRNAKVQKTALGTDRLLGWSHHDSAPDALAAVRDDGYTLVGLELTSTASPLAELAIGDATCVAVGHEDRGLTAAVLAGCAALAYVPTPGKVGSLNVATATSIALYEARRQEWAGPA